jgi:hypothetical protein
MISLPHKKLLILGIRRLLARGLDLAILFTVCASAVYLLYGEEIARAFALDKNTPMLVIALHIPIDAAFSYYFGRGPGKYFFGLLLTHPISLSSAVARALIVAFVGQGLAIELVSQLLLIVAGLLYLFKQTTAWDWYAGTNVAG